ncbi:major facilitator superfamily domain-containing protein [Xylariaceae sp. FL0804]|nr:major facilitator superfamily domain-containing protein [Xylariaceae sp. FL0804]
MDNTKRQSEAVVTSSPTRSEGEAAENIDESLSQSIQRHPTSRWRRVLGSFWDSVDGDPKQRKFVQKLDSYLFSYICLGYFIKYLDQTNYINAFVSGMQEDLGLYGNQRNLLNTYFSIGIIVGTVPSQLVQLRFIRPSLFIPGCELLLSVLVMAMASAKRVETLYALRFLVGLLEACSFPGYAALLGGWYGPTEMTKRVAIFQQTSSIASMFSGYLQARLYTGLDGRLGLAGWKWLFIFDGIISVPIAVWGFFAIPDLPHTTRAFYWTQEEKMLGVARMEKIGRKPPQRLTLSVLRKVFTNWRLWVFILPYLMVAQAGSGTNYFNLWLKAEGYSVVQTNILPTAGNALSIVAAFAFGLFADASGHRLAALIVIQLLVMLSNILLSVWSIPKPALLFAFYLSYVGAGAQPIVIAWGNELNKGDDNLRQLLVATGNLFSYCFMTWMPLIIFPTYDAPKYKYGYQILILFGALAIIGSALMYMLQQRPARAAKKQSATVENGAY